MKNTAIRLRLSAKTKRDGWTDRQTYRLGHFNISHPGPLARDKLKMFFSHLGFGFIECFTITFLHTNSWLNWVDEMIDEGEVGFE